MGAFEDCGTKKNGESNMGRLQASEGAVGSARREGEVGRSAGESGRLDWADRQFEWFDSRDPVRVRLFGQDARREGIRRRRLFLVSAAPRA
jgi:hypothetical protein